RRRRGPAAVRRLAPLRHQRQGRLGLEHPALELTARHQGEPPAGPRVSLSVPPAGSREPSLVRRSFRRIGVLAFSQGRPAPPLPGSELGGAPPLAGPLLGSAFRRSRRAPNRFSLHRAGPRGTTPRLPIRYR